MHIRNCIVPLHILLKLAESKDKRYRELALKSLLMSTHIRAQRSVLGLLPIGTNAGEKRRTIYDAQNNETDPPSGVLVRGEGDGPSSDTAVNEAYNGLGATYDFYRDVYDRNSLDGNGMRLDAIVHYGDGFNNAFWDGQRMVFGDGDEDLFVNFTKSLDVISHELTHGVTEFSAGLVYHRQPGALNESMSDVFGSLVKQWSLGQDAVAADWLIGSEIFTPGIAGDALRSLKAPGTAYDNPLFGKDPQPAHMNNFRNLPDTRAGDWGGVHINSGIPNHAFYLVATSLGGNAWDAPGHIWYETLTKNLGPEAQFQDFADSTFGVAGRLYGLGSQEQLAVREAWRAVGIRISGAGSIAPTKTFYSKAAAAMPLAQDSLLELHEKIDAFAKALDAIVKKKG